MKIVKAFALGVAFLAAVPASAEFINFDQLPNTTTLPITGTTISNQYASLGVTFQGTNTQTGATGALNSWGILAASGPGGSRNYLGNFGEIPDTGSNNYLLAPRYDVTSLLFSTATSGISFGLNTFGARSSVTITAYDAGGAVLQTLAGVQANNGIFEVQTVSASNVFRLDIRGGFNNPPNGSVLMYGIDNLSFTPAPAAPVPEPATWAMMIGGFGVAGAALRRRRLALAIAQ